MKKQLFSTRDICEVAIFTAIAIVLGMFVEVKIGQNGGSIGFAMIPLFIICLRHGPLVGFISAGVIYGLTQCLYDAYGFASYPFDYLLAYGSLAIVGFFRKQIFSKGYKSYLWTFLMITIACFLRFMFHVISGMLIWETPLGGSISYNATYMVPSYILTVVLFLILLEPFKKINTQFKTRK